MPASLITCSFLCRSLMMSSSIYNDFITSRHIQELDKPSKKMGVNIFMARSKRTHQKQRTQKQTSAFRQMFSADLKPPVHGGAYLFNLQYFVINASGPRRKCHLVSGFMLQKNLPKRRFI